MSEITYDMLPSSIELRLYRLVDSQHRSKDTKIDDLGLDSLEFLSLVVDLDEEFGVSLGAQNVARCTTLSDLISLVRSQHPQAQ
jgi:acyl carrier protein